MHPAIEFLERFHGDAFWVLSAINPDRTARKRITTRTFSSKTADRALAFINEYNDRWNLYYAVGQVEQPVNKMPEKSDIARTRWLHVDVDARAGEAVDVELVRIRRLFDELPGGVPRPTLLVCSGGGFQALWRLREPVDLNGDWSAVEGRNMSLEHMLGGDRCHNINRVLRLPGTWNVPDKKKIERGRAKSLARVEWFDDGAYDLTDFEMADVPSGDDAQVDLGSVVVNKDDVHRIQIDDLDKWGVPDRVKRIIVHGEHSDEPKKDDNTRSAWLFDCCCQLVRCGVPDDVVYSVITDESFDISASVLDKGAAFEKYALRQIARAKAEVEHPELAELNKRFAIIGDYGGKCVVLEEYRGRDAEFQSYGVQSRDHFTARFGHRHVQTSKDKAEPLGRWWLKHRHARRYERVLFAPDGRVADSVLNLWRGFAVEPSEGDCGLFLEHVRDNICAGNEQHAEWLFSWMARAVQKPSQAAEIAVVLRGARGVGKTFFAEEFGALFGRHFLAIANARHLVGNFNVHLEDCLVLLADEAFFAGDKRHASVLKSLITGSKLPVERKGYDLRTARNHLHLIMCSNDAWVVPAGLDERRFFVLDVAPSHQRDTDYFGRVARQLQDGGHAALLHLLLNRDISGWDFRRAPDTKSLLDQKILSLAPVQRAVYEMLCTGAHPRSLVDGESVFVVTEDLARDIGQKTVKARGLAFELKAITDGQVRETINKERYRGFWLPPLQEARDRWATTHGLDGVRWPDDVTQWNGAEEASDDDLPF